MFVIGRVLPLFSGCVFGLEKLGSNTPCCAEYPLLWVLGTNCSVLISLDVILVVVKSSLYYEKKYNV